MHKEKSIDLSGKELKRLPELQSQTKHLRADNNSLLTVNTVPPGLLSLSLAHNKLAFLGPLNIPNLRELDLSHNRLISLEGVSECSNLRKLFLNYNFLGDDQVPLLGNLKNLKILDISHNHLKDVDFKQVLEHLEDLEELRLSKNDFVQLDFNFDLKGLKVLNLDGNKLNQLSLQTNSLEVLSCNYNSLQSIHGVQNLGFLKEIYAEGNDFTKLSQSWNSLKHLKILHFSHNKLKKVCVLDNPSLQCVLLSYNKLQLAEFIKCPNLSELHLSHNFIKELPQTSMIHLQILDFSHNQLTSLSHLSNFPNLQVLNIAQNNYSPQNLFSNIKDLESLVILDVRGCALYPNARLRLVSHFIYSIQEINGEPVSQQEKDKALDYFEGSFSWDITNSVVKPSSLISSGASGNLFPSFSASMGFSDSGSNQYSRTGMTPENSPVKESLSLFPSLISPQETEPYDEIFPGLEEKRQHKRSASSFNRQPPLPPKTSFSDYNDSLKVSSLDFNEHETSKPPRNKSISQDSQQLTLKTHKPEEEDSFSIKQEMNRLYEEMISKLRKDIDDKYKNLKSELKDPKRKPLAELKHLENKKHKHCKKRCRKHKHKIRESPIKLIDQGTSPPQFPQQSETPSMSSISSDLKALEEIPSSSENELDYVQTFAPDEATQTKYLIAYATTPPRPILSSEACTTLTCQVSENGGEFALIKEIFASEDKHLLDVQKFFNYSLQKDLVQNSDCFSDSLFLKRNSRQSNMVYAFHMSGPNETEAVCNDPKGFFGLYASPSQVEVFKSIKDCEESYSVLTRNPLPAVKQIVIGLVPWSCITSFNDVWELNDSVCVPVYLAEYN